MICTMYSQELHARLSHYFGTPFITRELQGDSYTWHTDYGDIVLFGPIGIHSFCDLLIESIGLHINIQMILDFRLLKPDKIMKKAPWSPIIPERIKITFPVNVLNSPEPSSIVIQKKC